MPRSYYHGRIPDAAADALLVEEVSNLEGIGSMFLMTDLAAPVGEFTHQLRFVQRIADGLTSHVWPIAHPDACNGDNRVTARTDSGDVSFSSMPTCLAWNRSFLRLGLPFKPVTREIFSPRKAPETAKSPPHAVSSAGAAAASSSATPSTDIGSTGAAVTDTSKGTPEMDDVASGAGHGARERPRTRANARQQARDG